MFDREIVAAATSVLATCRANKLGATTAESCTGGLVAGALTAIAGSSDVVDRCFVTYSNDAKRELLGVPWEALLGYGAVSEPVARAMAAGALARTGAAVAVAVTGIAGPGGGTATKPVGLVHFAAARRGGLTLSEKHVFAGDRDAVRRQATLLALQLLDRAARQA